MYYFLLFILIIKIFIILNTRWDRSPTCLIGKTAIVTGANRGIGYYTALDFAKRGARVILACRDSKKAEIARNKIIEKSGNSNVIVGIVDFTSLASVRAFAKQIKNTEARLDILVNNAGAGGFDGKTTEDGLNLLMQTNYFGPALLTLLLIDLLKKSAPSRIVNLTSVLAIFARLNTDNINAWATFSNDLVNKFINYGNTKLCIILFTNELARRLVGSGVTVNSLHPGAVRTAIYENVSLTVASVYYIILYIWCKTTEEGAQTTIYVAVSKDLEGVTGEYLENCRIAWCPPIPYSGKDKSLAKVVWNKTEECLKLTSEERLLLYKQLKHKD